MHFQATPELIQQSVRLNCCGCPVGRVVNKQLKADYIFHASYAFCAVYDYENITKPLQKIETPPNLAAVMKQFDHNVEIEPFEFDLPIREEFLKPVA